MTGSGGSSEGGRGGLGGPGGRAAGGAVGSGGMLGSGGRATGGIVGSGGVTPGSGGHGGSGGTMGTGGTVGSGGMISTGGMVGTGGAVGSGGVVGTGGTTPPSCAQLAQDYQTALSQAKVCDLNSLVNPCTQQVESTLSCFGACATFIDANKTSKVKSVLSAWQDAGFPRLWDAHFAQARLLRYGLRGRRLLFRGVAPDQERDPARE